MQKLGLTKDLIFFYYHSSTGLLQQHDCCTEKEASESRDKPCPDSWGAAPDVQGVQKPVPRCEV